MKKTILLLLTCFLLVSTAIAKNQHIKKDLYAILVPMNDESMQLLADIENKKHKVIRGVHYIEGFIKGKTVVFANTGLGKANVSAITARLIQDYQPKFIFLAGSAGKINSGLNKYAVVIGSRLIDADLGTLTEQGSHFPNEDYFSTPQKNNKVIPKYHTPELQLLHISQAVIDTSPLNTVLFGAIATSDVLPNPVEQITLLRRNNIDAVEMEGAAFMQTCWVFDTSCIVVRGISNQVDEEISKEDTIHAGNNATDVVERLIGKLANPVAS